MEYETNDGDPHADDGGTARYRQYLVGYLAVSVVGTGVLLFLVKRSTTVMAGIEVVAGVSLLAFASVVAIFALYKDAVGSSGSDAAWNPGWKKYVVFAVGSPVVAYAAIDYVTMKNVAVIVAAVALVIATVESCALYLYNRHQHVGRLA